MVLLGFEYFYLRICICLADKLSLWVYVSVRGTRTQLWGSSPEEWVPGQEGLGQGGA